MSIMDQKIDQTSNKGVYQHQEEKWKNILEIKRQIIGKK